MKNTTYPMSRQWWALLPVFLSPWCAAQIAVSDNFTGASASNSWLVFGGACLTAGSGAGSIPACQGNSYYTSGNVTLNGGYNGTMPDTTGQGALRLTNNTNYETGAIASGFTFPTGSGVNITFVTTTYGGNGADGMTFFLMDGSVTPTATYTGNSLGASGGSLGYSCSNGNPTFDGLYGGYIGVGIDEYGNFQNKGDNTSGGPVFRPNSVSVRGKGNVSWKWLNANYPNYYPSSLSASSIASAVHNTCSTNTLWNYSNGNSSNTGTALPAYSNYLPIPNPNANDGSYPALSNTFWSTTNSRSSANTLTYQLTITTDNLLSLQYSYNGGFYQSVLNNLSITNSNGPIPSTLRFGFTGATGGLNNIHEVTCFNAAPISTSASSGGNNANSSGNLQTNTQLYIPAYHSKNWWGQFSSYPVSFQTSTKTLQFGVVNSSGVNTGLAQWDAYCNLTGTGVPGTGTASGTCSSTGAALTAAQDPSASTGRVILTANWNTTSKTAVGTPFRWSNLTTAQQTALNTGDSNGSIRLDYLRGDRSQEIISSTNTGTFRPRTGVLGDIIDSNPAVQIYPTAPYTSDTWTDLTNSSATLPENATGATAYSSFASTNATRQNVVYVGANDGLLHGFRTGSYDSTGSVYQTSTNDGKEILAYMPYTVLNNIHSTTATADYSNNVYSHAYAVDGNSSLGDVFYNKAWHTWLVSGLGPGGAGIFALDVTSPGSFSESSASSIVQGEWNNTNISCSNYTSTSCANYLGNTYGTPQIRRFHNGQWGFIFGNGYGSTNNTAGFFFLGLIDSSSGAVTFYYFDTGSGSSSSPNGIAYVTPADLDGDHIVDYAYAGDLLGNIWRLDLTSSSPSNWKVSTYGTSSAKPLFTTPSSSVTSGGNTTTYARPITTKVAVALVPSAAGAYKRVMVDFGTGQRIEQRTQSAIQYFGGTQSLYGIWDWDMGNWNTLSPTNAGTKEKLTGTQTISVSSLQQQTVTSTVAATSTTNSSLAGYRTVSSNTVCWKGSTTCNSGNTQYGFYLDLPGTNEQVVYNAALYQGAVFVVNTTIPAINTPLNCQTALDTGWTMSISSSTGGALGASAFNTVSTTAAVAGIQLNAVGTPSFLDAYGRTFLVTNTSNSTPSGQQFTPLIKTVGSRINWQQIR
jgi:type IV pilus assembly protein PilY1